MNESRIVALVTHLFVQTPKLGQPVDNCETRQDPRVECQQLTGQQDQDGTSAAENILGN